MTSSGNEGSHLPLEAHIQSSQRPGEPLAPSVVEEHGKAERVPLGLASSRNSLFSVFRRARPSSTASVRSAKSSDSFLNAFDDFSVNVSSTNLESPKMARASSHKLRTVLKATEAYRNAMQALGIASADLGASLYDYADTKGCRSGQTALPEHHVDIDVDAAAGLHMLISSHLHVLSQSFNDNVETPMKAASEEYKDELAAREREFQRVLTAKMSALHTSESRRIKDSRSRSRNLDRYRNSLLDLTSQVDDINRAKFDFLSDLHSLETNVAESVHKSLSTAVTAEIEVFDAIARKGWSGAGLDGLLAGCPDPFDDHRPSPKREASGTNLFSMIPSQPIVQPEHKGSVDYTDLDDLSHEKTPKAHHPDEAVDNAADSTVNVTANSTSNDTVNAAANATSSAAANDTDNGEVTAAKNAETNDDATHTETPKSTAEDNHSQAGGAVESAESAESAESVESVPISVGNDNDIPSSQATNDFRPKPVKYSAMGSSSVEDDAQATSTPSRHPSNSAINSATNSTGNSTSHTPVRASSRASSHGSNRTPTQPQSPSQSTPQSPLNAPPSLEPSDTARSANSIYNTKPGTADGNTSVDSMALDVHL